MTTERITTFLAERAESWNRRDPSALAADHAETGLLTSPMFGRVQGREAIRASYTELFVAFPDWRIRFEAPIVDDRRAAVAFSATGTHQGPFMGLRGTGRRCGFEGVSLFVLGADVLIVEERRYYDFTGFLSQVGVLRLKPA
jgi:steroid delta-isomerase-like uncharacterized protein